MYSGGIDKAAKISEIERIGARISDYSHDELVEIGLEDFEIWPENFQSYMVFSAMSTQWRTGFNGVTGLDYNVLPEIWRRLKIPFQDRDYIFKDIMIMENKALEIMRDNK